MSISTVGNYRTTTTYRPVTAAQPLVTAATSGTTSQSTSTTQPQGTTLSIGRMASWAGGAWAASRYILPMIGRQPGGLVIGGVLAGGAWVGNKVYNMFTGQNAGGTSGQTGRYISWGAGALAAWKWVVPMIGRPTGLVTAGVIGAGAWVGNKVYNFLTGK